MQFYEDSHCCFKWRKGNFWELKKEKQFFVTIFMTGEYSLVLICVQMMEKGATPFRITTLSITTFSIMTLSRKCLFWTLSINDIQHK